MIFELFVIIMMLFFVREDSEKIGIQLNSRTELYPRSQIDVFVEVLQADGGNYCACVNAATLALVDAGIPMRDYVCACTASLMNDVPLLDVSSLVSSEGKLVFLQKSRDISKQIIFVVRFFYAQTVNENILGFLVGIECWMISKIEFLNLFLRRAPPAAPS